LSVLSILGKVSSLPETMHLNGDDSAHQPPKRLSNPIVLTDESSLDSQTIQEPHYDVLAAAVSGTAATMLTLLAMLGGSVASTTWLKMLFDAQLAVIELALIAGIVGLIRRNESQKRRFSHVAAILLVAGAILLGFGAVIV